MPFLAGRCEVAGEFFANLGGIDDQVRFYVPLTLRVALVVPVDALHDASST